MPTLTTSTADVTVGDPIHDTATLSGYMLFVGGTMTFAVYGPDDETCAGAPLDFPDAVRVSGYGGYRSPDFTPIAPGVYRWTVEYSGDYFGNDPVSITCSADNETSIIWAADQDADGIPDSIDDCPTSPGPGKTNGCTGIKRALSLQYKRHAFRGTLMPPDACGTEEKVTVLVKSHGRTRKVGGARTNARGRYAMSAVRHKGTYYARSLNSLEPNVGICLATQSKRILSR